MTNGRSKRSHKNKEENKHPKSSKTLLYKKAYRLSPTQMQQSWMLNQLQVPGSMNRKMKIKLEQAEEEEEIEAESKKTNSICFVTQIKLR